MEYFRSLGTSLLQQSGVVLPFALGERVTSFDREGTIWTLWDAVKRDDSTPISVFSFDASTPFAGRPDRRTFLPIAKNALKKIRSTRHPDILKFIDAHETESTIYIATERVKPLCSILSDATSVKLEEEYIMWGLQKITTALSFLNTQAVSVHGLVRPSSIFVTESGEWRLGGLDLLSSTRPTELETGVLWSMGGLVAGKEGVSPEVNKEGWSILKTLDPSSHDAYTLGLLIHKLFNPTHPAPPTSQPPHPPPQPSSRGAIPPSIFPQFKRMLNPNPKTRLTASGFLGEGGEPDSRRGYFAGNRFVWVGEGLEGWALRGEGERAELLKNIQSTTPPFPPAFLTHKVLPSLLHSLTLPSQTSSASALLPLVLRLGNLVPPQDYVKLVLDPVVKLYQSPDRGTRMALLEGLGEYEGKMDNKCVQERVWPHLITGFADTVPVIREATVKAIPLIAPKLSDRLLNNDLLRLLAKMQTDPEPSIRTNTCILLGRLAKNLGPNTKRKVLVPAFARSLKDSFVHARVAGLMAFMATVEVYEKEDLAGRVIPVCSGALVDGEKLVRDQAFIAVNLFVQRLEKLVASMPESAQPNGPQVMTGVSQMAPNAPTTQAQAQAANGNSNGQVPAISSASGAAGALAGWAFASLGKQLASADLQSTMSEQPIPGSFGSAAPPQSSSSSNNAFSNNHTSSYSSQPPKSPSKPAASMRLSSSSNPHSSFGGSSLRKPYPTNNSAIDDILQAEAAAEEEDSVADAWGADLIDVEADGDDWGGFEEAPVPLYPTPPTYPTPAPPPLPPISAPTPVVKKVVAKPKPKPKTTPAPAPAPAPKPVAAPPPPPPPTPPPRVETPEPPAVNLSSLSKEEKEAEMVRRREERKARIAGLKKAKA